MCWGEADVTVLPHRFPCGGETWGRMKRVHLVTSAWGMGEVVTRTVLRATSEFMIYHSLL